MVRRIFYRQFQHIVFLLLLLFLVRMLFRALGTGAGEWGGLTTAQWFSITLASAIIHQCYVLLTWRIELHTGGMSSVLGRLAFPLYSVFFMLLLFSRPVLILALALADRGSLAISPSFLWGLAAALLLPVGYVFYSVLRYFGIQRALGIDHFDRSYRDRPLVDGGIFRYVRNGMYLYGLLILYIPGLLLASEASLLAAFFQHTYIWVHYFTLEAPDMQIIFADRPPGRAKWGS